MSELFDGLGALVASHVRLAMAALVLALIIGLPLAVLGYRRPRVGRVLVGAAAVVQTIPALALLAVMVPVLAWMNLPSIGAWPALIGLALYGVFPILHNGVTGLEGVDATYRDAARGVGMTERQALWRVELPLALPVVVAGVRTAAVWMVGMATLSTPIGAPSLGNPIFAGLQTRRYDLVLLGCVSAAILALLLDGLIRALEVGMRTRRRWLVAASAALCVLAALASAIPLLGGSQPSVRVGAKTFTEQYVLSAILAQELEDEGERVEVVSSLGSTAVFDALADDQLDLYVEYSGTVWATLMQREGSAPRDQVLDEVRAWLESEHNVELVCALGFENTYALAVSSDTWNAGVRDIPSLAGRAGQWVIGGDYEFFERAEWRALRDEYGLRFAEERAMDPALMVDALSRDDVQVISAYSTDGRLAALGHRVLADPRQAIPPYDAILLASPGFAQRRPELVEHLRALEGRIDAQAMQQLNLAVDGEGRSPESVARSWRQ